MSGSGADIFLDSDAVLAQVDRLEQVVEMLRAKERAYRVALDAAARGDPRGYLGSGMGAGNGSLATASQARAEIEEVIRRVQATVRALVLHDAGASAMVTPVPIPATVPSGATTLTLPPADPERIQLLASIQATLRQRGVGHRSIVDSIPIINKQWPYYGVSYYGYGNQGDYTIEDLPLDLLTNDDLRSLAEYLGIETALSQVCRVPSLSPEEALGQIEILQGYWGYDNATMASALRELYYPTGLNPFIKDAGAIDASILNLGVPNASEEARSRAALALTLLHLSRQHRGYVEPLLPITRGGQEIGMDHVIAGLDAIFHPAEVAEGRLNRDGLRVFGVRKINSLYAVTWQGDLGAAGQQTYNKATDSALFGHFPDLEACRDIQNMFDAGYCVEMPPEDREGDIMANVIAFSRQRLGLDETNHNLAQVLSTAYDQDGSYYPNRYRLFAASVGLDLHPVTGTLDPQARRRFIEDNIPYVQAFSQGLVAGELRSPSAMLHMSVMAPAFAQIHLEQFLDEIQAGIFSSQAVRPGQKGSHP